MTDLGWIGVWLLAVSLVLILIEGVLAMLWTVRVSRSAEVLNARITAEQALLQADVVRLQESLDEMRALWQPYRRLLRCLRHPITIALMQSLMRRRVAAR